MICRTVLVGRRLGVRNARKARRKTREQSVSVDYHGRCNAREPLRAASNGFKQAIVIVARAVRKRPTPGNGAESRRMCAAMGLLSEAVETKVIAFGAAA